MSQHDLDIANQGFPATRADLNNALKALGSTNSGGTAPSTTYANQLWYDTANNILKIRNEDNDAFINLIQLDQTNDDIEALTVGGTLTVGDGHTIADDGNDNLTLTSSSGESIKYDSTAGNHLFLSGGSETVRIDSNGRMGIGATTMDEMLLIQQTTAGANTDLTIRSANDGGSRINFGDQSSDGVGRIDYDHTNNFLAFTTNSAERMRITSAGSVFVNTTTGNTTSGTNGGIVLNNVGTTQGRIDVGNTGTCFNGNRSGSHGDVYVVRYEGARRGGLMTSSSTGQACLQGGNVGITFTTNGRLNPTNSSGASSDNAMDLGQSDSRFDDVFATNGTIQTSDQNEKQQIASLTTTEMTAAKAISKLFKTFKWNSAVQEKGDGARTHSGVIAQDVQQALTDAGLDASNYAFFISDTWWQTTTDVPAVEEDEEAGIEAQDAYTRVDKYYTADEAPEGATQRTRLGIRYPELLAFIGAATEQRLADIETRVAALEA